MRGDLEDNENRVVRITVENACCSDRGNGYNVAKDKREEAVATSLSPYIPTIAQSTNNIHPQPHVFPH